MENFKTLLSKLPQVALSPEGVFKYILIQVSHKGETIEFVRGHASLEYHAQNFDRFVKEFNDAKLMLNGEPLKANHNVEVKCPGGGRVKHSAAAKTLSIYGYSQAYGQGDHDRVAEIVRQALDYSSIEVSYQGY